MRFASVLAASALSLAAASASAQAPFTPNDLVVLKRLSDPQVSPDGRYAAYVLRETDLEANRGRTDLWLLDLKASAPVPRRLTQNPANDSSPRWSADSRTIYFLSTRSGSSQIWRLPLAGGEPLAVTSLPLDIGSFKVSPASDRLAFSVEVFPDCADLDCTKKRLDELEASKSSGKQFDQLFVRHWDTWFNGTRSHLFTARIGADGAAGTPVDLSKTLDGDVPSKPMGGDEEYAFSPDGTQVAFSLREAGRTEAWSTNFDLFETRADGSTSPTNLTKANAAWDTQPVYLGNGDLAWIAMERPGFESDRFRVMLRSARGGAVRPLTLEWDRSVSRLGATFDGKRLLATADDVGQLALFSLDPASGKPTPLVGTGHVDEYAAAPGGVLIAWASLAGPADLYLATGSGEPRRLTSVNADLLGSRSLSAFEQFSFAGWNGETVHGYVMKPYGFVSGRKYPIAFIVHGGPQVSFANAWSYRWNPQVFAGHGFAPVFIDFHGSPGYGQAFTDSISGDWGGKPFEDLQKGLAAALAQFDWLDGSNACSLGASYGGFMQNWIAGKWPDGFRCIVNHAGIFDSQMMYYTTEELWFDEWEHGGTYFDRPQAYEQWDPSRFVTAWKTPMLVTHGVKDFRVPYSQGLAAFTALQRRGIPSRFLVFPDENHWILKPANSLQWHAAVFEWMDTHLKK